MMFSLKKFPYLIIPCAFFNQASAMVDANGNGASDVWEQKYNATALVVDPTKRAEDEDSDGYSNIAEAKAGTDPRDYRSCPCVKIISKVGSDVEVSYPTEIGKKYQIYMTSTLGAGATWVGVGDAEVATTILVTRTLTGQSDAITFYRVKIVGWNLFQ